MGLRDGTREGIHDPESGDEGVWGPIQAEEALSGHRSASAGEGDGACGEAARKDGGLSHPISRFMGELGPKLRIGVGRRLEENSARGFAAHLDGVLPASSPQAHPHTS